MTEVARESISASNLSSVRSNPSNFYSTLLPDQGSSVRPSQENERPGHLLLIHTTNNHSELAQVERDGTLNTKASSTINSPLPKKNEEGVIDTGNQKNPSEEISRAVHTEAELTDSFLQQTTIDAMNGPSDESSPQEQQAHSEKGRIGWFAWLMQSRSPEMPVKNTMPTQTPDCTPAVNAPSSDMSDNNEHTSTSEGNDKEMKDDHKDAAPESQDESAQYATSWLQKLKSSVFSSPSPAGQEEQTSEESPVSQDSGPIGLSDTSTSEAAESTTANQDTSTTESNHWGSTWFFWSGDKSKELPGQTKDTKSSQSAQDGENMSAPDEQSQSPKESIKGGPVSLPPGVTPDKIANTKKPIADSRTKDGKTVDGVKAQPFPSNQLLPPIRDTLKVRGRPRFLEQIGRLFMSSREEPSNHVSLTQDPPRIKKAVSIGVHGYFPVQILRKVLGPPTGTSIRFATMGAKAISEWAEEHGHHCNVTKIPLEGEGRIAERVDMLWNALLSYLDEIKNSDFVLVSCHSQGVPVATMLVAKLIDVGCINASRIGICAMAGVNLGPFADYRSRLIGGAAGELFDFANPASKVSQAYARAVEHVLSSGSKITYVGSIDDQLVPMEVCT